MGQRYLTALHKELGFRPMSDGPGDAHVLFSFVGITFLAASFLGLTVYSAAPPLLASILALNLTTLILCGYDKAVAGSGATRVPEAVLMSCTLAGGSLGMLVGMFLFRHKIRKGLFVFLVLLIVTAHLRILKTTEVGRHLTEEWHGWKNALLASSR
jgi:uncharacterized membrane protein YsdA (DUF1294 family)